MKIDRIVVGELDANCYVVTINDKSYLIDPGSEKEKIKKYLENKNIVGILVTHSHFDHVGELDYFLNLYKLKENVLDDEVEIIKTPGHTSDSVTFYFKNYKTMFTGDFIFKGAIGRMDLPTGSVSDMKNSLSLISLYDDDTLVYPGHGDSTVLKEEIKNFKYYLEML